MNRRQRRQAEREARRAAPKYLDPDAELTIRPLDHDDVARLYTLKDCEPLTDDLIDFLLDVGWPRERLEWAYLHTGFYCAPRGSIIIAPTELLNDASVEELLSATVHEMELNDGEVLDHYHRVHR